MFTSMKLMKVLRYAFDVGSLCEFSRKHPNGESLSEMFLPIEAAFRPLAAGYVKVARRGAVTAANFNALHTNRADGFAGAKFLEASRQFESAMHTWLAVPRPKRFRVAEKWLGPGAGEILDQCFDDCRGALRQSSEWATKTIGPIS